MIALYYDRNLLEWIASPGNQSPAGPQKWVFADNYNLAIYILASGAYQTINAGDTLKVVLYPTSASTLPVPNDAIIGTASALTDSNGNQFYSININLNTTAIQTLVQTGATGSATFLMRCAFSPVDGERLSDTNDLSITIIADVTSGATGATPASGTYPALNGNSGQVLVGTGGWVTPGFPVATFQFGQALLNFGAATSGGSDTAITTVSAAWATVNSLPHVQIVSGGDHNDLDDAAIEDLNAVCGNIVIGVSFDIELFAPNGATDRYAVNWFSTV